MLVSFLTMQQEVNDLKSEKETYEQELESVFRNNEEFIPKDGNIRYANRNSPSFLSLP